jgi:hypothetical protein
MQTLLDMGSNQNSTIVFPIPIELIKPLFAALVPMSEPVPSRSQRAGTRDARCGELCGQEHVGQLEAREGRAMSEPTRLQGQALNYKQFIGAVQEAGAHNAVGASVGLPGDDGQLGDRRLAEASPLRDRPHPHGISVLVSWVRAGLHSRRSEV